MFADNSEECATSNNEVDWSRWRAERANPRWVELHADPASRPTIAAPVDTAADLAALLNMLDPQLGGANLALADAAGPDGSAVDSQVDDTVPRRSLPIEFRAPSDQATSEHSTSPIDAFLLRNRNPAPAGRDLLLYLCLGRVDVSTAATGPENESMAPLEGPLMAVPLRTWRRSRDGELRVSLTDADLVGNTALVCLAAHAGLTLPFLRSELVGPQAAEGELCGVIAAAFDDAETAVNHAREGQPGTAQTRDEGSFKRVAWMAWMEPRLPPSGSPHGTELLGCAPTPDTVSSRSADGSDSSATPPSSAGRASHSSSSQEGRFAIHPMDSHQADVAQAITEFLAPTGGSDLDSIESDDAMRAGSVVQSEEMAVLLGPPGSGKSATAANVVAALVERGVSVLVVSPTNASVARMGRMLARAGLERLMLHADGVLTRRYVTESFAFALDERPHPPTELSANEQAQLQARRGLLTAHAAALVETRSPSSQHLGWMFDRLADLGTPPALPPPDPTNPATPSHDQVLSAAIQLADSWDPVSRPSSFLWRDLADPRTAADQQQSLLALVDRVLDQRRTTQSLLESVAESLALPTPRGKSALAPLQQLADLVPLPEGTAADWLTCSDQAIIRIEETLRNGERSANDSDLRAESLAASTSSIDPETIPVGTSDRLSELARSLHELQPPFVLDRERAISSLPAIADDLRWFAGSAENLADGSEELQQLLGLAAQEPGAESTNELLIAVELAAAPARPDNAWLTPEGLAAAETAAGILFPLQVDVRQRWEQLNSTFRQEALAQNLQFLTQHHPTLFNDQKIRSADRRAARTAVQGMLVDGADADEGVRGLPGLLGCQEATHRWRVAADAHGPALGIWWNDLLTDETQTQAALELARQLDGRHGPAIPQVDGDRLAQAHQAANNLRQQLETHQHALATYLSPPLGPVASEGFGHQSRWFQSAVELVSDLVAATQWAWQDNAPAAPNGPDHTIGSVAQLAVDYERATLVPSDDAVSNDQMLGPSFRGPDSDWAMLLRA